MRARGVAVRAVLGGREDAARGVLPDQVRDQPFGAGDAFVGRFARDFREDEAVLLALGHADQLAHDAHEILGLRDVGDD